MKNMKRIFAILGIILLAGLYVSTLIFALLGRDYFQMLMGAVTATIVIPVLLWLYTMVYKQIHKRKSNGENKSGY